MKKLLTMSLLVFVSIMLTGCNRGLYSMGFGYRSSYRPHVDYYDYDHHDNYTYAIGYGGDHHDRGRDRHQSGSRRRGGHDRGHDGGRRGGGHR